MSSLWLIIVLVFAELATGGKSTGDKRASEKNAAGKKACGKNAATKNAVAKNDACKNTGGRKSGSRSAPKATTRIEISMYSTFHTAIVVSLERLDLNIHVSVCPTDF